MALAVTPGVAEPAMYPLHRSKVVYLVRHGQGFHNVVGELDKKAYESEEFFDASLTAQGWQQVAALRKHVRSTGIFDDVELVVTSPLTRTMQTASGVFGSGDVVQGDSSTPLMVEGVGKADHAAISSASAPPFVAVELCREQLGIHPCDKRQTVSEYRNLFPAIDFSEVVTDEDTLWKADVRETKQELFDRGRVFLRWVLDRRQARIAVVSHSSFLSHLVDLHGQDCTPVVKMELTAGFRNCEMRCVVIADRSATSLVPSGPVLNFPGGSPAEPSAGSDLADVSENGSA